MTAVLKTVGCKSHRGSNPLPYAIFMGVIWFRRIVKDAEITGMIPPYGSNKRTDEDNTYGELKAA